MVDVKSKGSGRQNVAIGGEIAEAFRRACKGRAVGRSMNDAANRIIYWFTRQADYVQTAVTSDVDRGMEAHYAAALRQLADELERKPLDVVVTGTPGANASKSSREQGSSETPEHPGPTRRK